MQAKNNPNNPIIKFVTKQQKTLSPTQIDYLNKLNKLQITREIVHKLKTSGQFSTSLQKILNKKKKKKKKDKPIQSQTKYPKSYSSCECIQQLNNMAVNQSSSIKDILREKQTLTQAKQRLKFYTNVKESRQAYFIEEIQRKNMETVYLRQKLEEKLERNRTELSQIQQRIKSLKSPKKKKTKSKTQPKK